MALTRFLFLFFIVACTLSQNACVSTDRTVLQDSEGVVPEDFFKSVRKNKTQRDWIVGNLGEPSAVDNVLSAEFLTYRLAKTRYKKTSVLLVFNKGVIEEKAEFYHVMICKDKVRRAWLDKLSTVQGERYAKKNKHCRKRT